jgi:2-hydroxy-3-keto-5-methylthiopentenyl-1-phosphate phosphatase
MSPRAPGIGALVVDFDGTICPQDVSEELLEEFAGPEWWEIDVLFQRGEIGSRECLVRQAELLRVGRPEMLAFALDRFGVDPTFPPLVRWGRGAGIRVAVASDGFGFYVEPMLRAAGVDDVDVLANRFDFTAEGPRFSLPWANPECVGCGCCKMLAVLRYRERFGRVAFVGEGHTDRYGALYSDVVFAKKHLVEICRADGVPFLPWDTFDDVRAGLEEEGAAIERLSPQRCPGWIPA